MKNIKNILIFYQKTLDKIHFIVYNIYVRKRGGDKMDEKKKEALQELLKILCDCPELADRITITIKPNSKPSKAEPESE